VPVIENCSVNRYGIFCRDIEKTMSVASHENGIGGFHKGNEKN
jgi:hypothetical protein